MSLRCGQNNHTKKYCKKRRVHCSHCKSQKHASHCCAFIPKATSTSHGETSDTASNSGTSSSKRSQQSYLPTLPHKTKNKSRKNKQQQHQAPDSQQQQQQQQQHANPRGAPPAPQPNGGQAQLPPAFQQQGQQQQYPSPPLGRYTYPPSLPQQTHYNAQAQQILTSKILLQQPPYGKWHSSINSTSRPQYRKKTVPTKTPKSSSNP